jgi:hypothetical protein
LRFSCFLLARNVYTPQIRQHEVAALNPNR